MMEDLDWHLPLVDKDVDWAEIINIFPVIEELKGVCQSPRYHKEGDVYNHTVMTIEALCKDDNWMRLDDPSKSLIFLSTLLHDVGKITTTKEEDGELRSHGHSTKGARRIRKLLWDFEDGYNVPWEVREYISTMSLLHMLPIYFLDKEDPLYSICAASQTVINRDLAMLSDADTNGRICDGQDESLATIELFREFCDDNECLMRPRRFESDHSRFLYLFDRVGHHSLSRYDDCKGTVHIMSGLPGSGKDYYISENLNDVPVVSLDGIRNEFNIKPGRSKGDEGRVSQEAKTRCREHMRKKDDFVLNATNLLKSTRSKWIRLFRDYDYRIHIHYVEPSFQIILNQNSNRDAKVPDHVIKSMFAKLEPPTQLECHELTLKI